MKQHALLALPFVLLAAASAPEDPAQEPQQAPPKETAQRLAELESAMVPVGGVILWWGEASALPPGFEVCDGTMPLHRNAALKERKPDLRDRFVKCAKDISGYRPRTALDGGSILAPVRHTAEHALSTDEIPAHLHPIPHNHTVAAHTHSMQGHTHTLPEHLHGIGTWIEAALSGTGTLVLAQDPNGRATTQLGGQANSGPSKPADTGSGGGGPTSGASTPNSGLNTTRGLGHVHDIPPFDIRPPYLEMLYIIRVQ